MKIRNYDWVVSAAALAGILLLGSVPGAGQTLAAASTAIPRMPDGKPDLSGVWEAPFVSDMSKSGRNQQGAGPLPYTDWAKAHLKETFDSQAHCLPPGYTRALNAPFPIEIVQRPDRIVILYENNNLFHVIFTDGRGHPKDLEPLWAGHSIGKWEGDTLVVDTVGFNDKTVLDTSGNPHSEQLHVVERFQRADATHIAYEVTIDDPQAYTKSWKNVRTFTLLPEWNLMEFSCEENNKDVTEGHIK